MAPIACIWDHPEKTLKVICLIKSHCTIFFVTSRDLKLCTWSTPSISILGFAFSKNQPTHRSAPMREKRCKGAPRYWYVWKLGGFQDSHNLKIWRILTFLRSMDLSSRSWELFCSYRGTGGLMVYVARQQIVLINLSSLSLFIVGLFLLWCCFNTSHHCRDSLNRFHDTRYQKLCE